MNESRQASLDAWEVARKGVRATKRKILDYVDTRPEGVVSDEAQHALGIKHQNCSSRFGELWHDRLLIRTPMRRATSSVKTTGHIHFTPRHWKPEYGRVDPDEDESTPAEVVSPGQESLF
jgi:hypothetical protein